MTDITTERRGDVTIVRLDRPKQLNALTAPMVAELHEVLEPSTPTAPAAS
jgi:enoyl-CoA hydratase/carnithine racemase